MQVPEMGVGKAYAAVNGQCSLTGKEFISEKEAGKVDGRPLCFQRFA